jgi:hypothetical protein
MQDDSALAIPPDRVRSLQAQRDARMRPRAPPRSHVSKRLVVDAFGCGNEKGIILIPGWLRLFARREMQARMTADMTPIKGWIPLLWRLSWILNLILAILILYSQRQSRLGHCPRPTGVRTPKLRIAGRRARLPKEHADFPMESARIFWVATSPASARR